MNFILTKKNFSDIVKIDPIVAKLKQKFPNAKTVRSLLIFPSAFYTKAFIVERFPLRLVYRDKAKTRAHILALERDRRLGAKFLREMGEKIKKRRELDS